MKVMKSAPGETTNNFPFDVLENYMKRVSDRCSLHKICN